MFYGGILWDMSLFADKERFKDKKQSSTWNSSSLTEVMATHTRPRSTYTRTCRKKGYSLSLGKLSGVIISTDIPFKIEGFTSHRLCPANKV